MGSEVLRSRHGGKTPSDRLAEGERMLADRNMGMRQSELMEKYGVSRPTLKRRLDNAINARLAVTVDAYREQQNALYDDLMKGHQEHAATAERMIRLALDAEPENVTLLEKGVEMRDKAMAGMLRVAERRAKLNGLDAPVKVEAEVVQVTPQEKELQEALAEARAQQERREAEMMEEQG